MLNSTHDKLLCELQLGHSFMFMKGVVSYRKPLSTENQDAAKVHSELPVTQSLTEAIFLLHPSLLYLTTKESSLVGLVVVAYMKNVSME